jgi:hypothetical protein
MTDPAPETIDAEAEEVDEPNTEIERYGGGPTQIMTRADLRNRTTDSWTDVLVEVGDLAAKISGTDFVPDGFKGNPAAVAATILQGREIGFPPMTALGSLHSIKGRVGLAAEAMRALVLQAGHELVTEISTSDKCRMKGRRKNSTEWTTVEWTMADARQAGLLGGSGWKNYPRQMLQARASAELCRLAFPDVTRGLASLEEIEQYDVIPGEETAPPSTGEGTKVKRKRAARKAAPKADAPAPDLPQTGEEGTETGEGSESSSPPDGASDQASEAPPLPGPEEGSPPAGEGASAEPPTVDDTSTPEGASKDAEAEAPPPLPDEPPLDEDGAVEAEIVEPAEPPINGGQRSAMIAQFNKLGVTDRTERLYMSEVIIGRQIESANHLTYREASSILDTLAMCTTNEELQAVINATAANREKGQES